MAKQALTWLDSFPPCETRETKVVRLLRTDGGAWGVTEARSAFVYPRSLGPLRKIAGIGGDNHSSGGLEDPEGLDVTQLLDEAFPVVKGVEEGNDNSNCDINNGKNNSSSRRSRHNNNDNNNTTDTTTTSRTAATSPARTAGNEPPADRRSKPDPEDNEAEGATGRARRRKGKRNTTAAVLPRPIFYPYGNGNTAPSYGGVVYGGYMRSHSISPQASLTERFDTHGTYERTSSTKMVLWGLQWMSF